VKNSNIYVRSRRRGSAGEEEEDKANTYLSSSDVTPSRAEALSEGAHHDVDIAGREAKVL
jgi:hypothetical protein